MTEDEIKNIKVGTVLIDRVCSTGIKRDIVEVCGFDSASNCYIFRYFKKGEIKNILFTHYELLNFVEIAKPAANLKSIQEQSIKPKDDFWKIRY